jgi:hypothetical protein
MENRSIRDSRINQSITKRQIPEMIIFFGETIFVKQGKTINKPPKKPYISNSVRAELYNQERPQKKKIGILTFHSTDRKIDK